MRQHARTNFRSISSATAILGAEPALAVRDAPETAASPIRIVGRMTGMVRDVASILEPYRDRSSNYGKPEVPLSDHLPMAVTALAGMGANDERLAAWAAAYVARQALPLAGVAETAGREKWRARIERDGSRKALADALRTLADGIGAAAFHAAIRAAYAIERNDNVDLACALESWEREFVALPVARTQQRVPVMEALHALAHAPLDRSDPDAWLIADGMRIVGTRDGFASLVATVPSSEAIDDLALAAAGAFAATGNFTALHLMTGTHAFRVLRRALGGADDLMPAFWSAYVAATIVAGVTPSLDAGTLDPLRDERISWDALMERAVAQDDDHVIKATYTAWRLDSEIGHPVFATAAARYLAKRAG